MSYEVTSGPACSLHGPAAVYSVITRSAHSTSDTKIAGVPYFAFQYFKSSSVTARAREHAPHEKTGRPFATTFSRSSTSGGQPIAFTTSVVALRIK